MPCSSITHLSAIGLWMTDGDYYSYHVSAGDIPSLNWIGPQLSNHQQTTISIFTIVVTDVEEPNTVYVKIPNHQPSK